MYNSKMPTQDELPTTRQLLRSTIIALILSFILMIAVVLPAEFGRDPTGVGRILGLTPMGEIKQSLADEVAMDKEDSVKIEITDVVVQQAKEEVSAQPRNDEHVFTLAPNESIEIKVDLQKGEIVSYVWFTNNGKVNFDNHGDSKKSDISYHGYGKGSKERDEGEIMAAFDGNHGWFWRNRTKNDLVITLQISGPYTNITRVK